MIGTYHRMPGSLLIFSPRPGITVTGASGACVEFETPPNEGLIIMVTPIDPLCVLVLLDNWPDNPGIAIHQHPHPAPFGAVWDLQHNLTPQAISGNPTRFQPVEEVALVGAPNGAVLLINDCDQPSSITDYVRSHPAYEPLPLAEQAFRAYATAALEAGVAAIPIHFGIDNIANLFGAGVSFAHRYPTIVKWALRRTQYPYVVWDGSQGFMKEKLDNLESVLTEHAGEWEGVRVEGEEAAGLEAELPDFLKGQLHDLLRDLNLGEGDDGPVS